MKYVTQTLLLIIFLIVITAFSGCNSSDKGNVGTQGVISSANLPTSNDATPTKDTITKNVTTTKDATTTINNMTPTPEVSIESALFKDNGDYTIKNPKTYVDKKFDFSVDYPSDWGIEIEETWTASATREGSPDSGINIYINENKKEKMYIYGQNGPIGWPMDAQSDKRITTSEGVGGEIFYREYNGVKWIQLVLDDGFHGAVITVSNDCFSQNSQQILSTLKSIKLKNK